MVPQPPVHKTIAFSSSVVRKAFGAGGTTGFTDLLEGYPIMVQTDADCYLSFDGADPSATHGIKLTAAMGPVVIPFACAGIEVVRVSGDGNLQITGAAASATVNDAS